MREGLTGRDDCLPKLMFEPLPDGPDKGQHMKDLEGMPDEYYDALGCDRETGILKQETLKKLDLEDIGKALEK